jgi:diguanylate cyclase (GGDEF)-like protein
MQIPPTPENEASRLKALYEYNLLDTPCEEIFDTITQLASSICGSSISAITLVDKSRQWFKSIYGLDITETSRNDSFCAHVILGDDIMEVEDARKDPRFHDNPLVTLEPKIHFYAGVPLKTDEGFNVGTLCVIDKNAIKLDERQKIQLKSLSKIIIALFDTRKLISDNNAKINEYIEATAKANLELQLFLESERKLNHASSALNDMYSMLQTCRSLDEAVNIINKHIHLAFEGVSGALYLHDTENANLNYKIGWHNSHCKKSPIRPDSCWSLRRGKFFASNTTDGISCDHYIHSKDVYPYICIPLYSGCESMGIICLEQQGDIPYEGESFLGILHPLAIQMGQNIALALTNINLRNALQKQSICDPLTNLYNRRYLYDYFKTEIAELIHEGLLPGVMILDIDHFKNINDEFGHAAGDEVLINFANLLNSVAMNNEIVARIGGEEFVLICLGKDKEDLLNRAKTAYELLSTFETNLSYCDIPSITVSAGFAVCLDACTDLSVLLKNADEGLYLSKNNGRNKMTIIPEKP